MWVLPPSGSDPILSLHRAPSLACKVLTEGLSAALGGWGPGQVTRWRLTRVVVITKGQIGAKVKLRQPC